MSVLVRLLIYIHSAVCGHRRKPRYAQIYTLVLQGYLHRQHRCPMIFGKMSRNIPAFFKKTWAGTLAGQTSRQDKKEESCFLGLGSSTFINRPEIPSVFFPDECGARFLDTKITMNTHGDGGNRDLPFHLFRLLLSFLRRNNKQSPAKNF